MPRDTYRWAADGLIDGSAPLNSIPHADIQDGDQCVVIKQGDCAYHYVYDGLSEAPQDVPNVIAPQDAGANPGRWVLHRVYDTGPVSDDAYNATSWNGATSIAPSKNAVRDKIETLMNRDGSNLAIGSDADGDMYYRANGVLARLAKGTAGQTLLMNSGATAPEWADMTGGDWTISAKTANYTVQTSDAGTWFTMSSTLSRIFYLPSLSAVQGKSFVFQRLNTGSVTINRAGSDVIEDALTSVAILARYDAIVFTASSDRWKVDYMPFTKGVAGTRCAAWVNFNGTGTVAIRASYNVSSITDNGTGDYTVNFATAMPDANYGYSLAGNLSATYGQYINAPKTTSPTTSALRIQCMNSVGTVTDLDYVCAALHR